ncbi:MULTISPECIES: hypothetical protein [unclassified Chryseobacterium]|uniref:hypothetical protein n=1 Tax=unclassified Chryseobacterium TaxID=2593645 RepID=UPI002269DEE5|nr:MULTISPECIES: hypothetical protein [unclassified Chryseobacterium]
MINKVIIFFLICIFFNSCKQKKEVVIKDDIYNLFNLNHYKIYTQKKINDSIYQYEGKNDRFLIKGRYNYIKKYKTGWWYSYDRQIDEKYVDIEFYKDLHNSKESFNQILLYKKNKIDTMKSKFYTKEYINKKILIYNFYCPISSDDVYSAQINIGIISNEKPLLYPTIFNCKRIKNGRYIYSLDISKYQEGKTFNMIGSFSEYSKKENALGINQIILDDTLNVN